jgi:hypothetical protein
MPTNPLPKNPCKDEMSKTDKLKEWKVKIDKYLEIKNNILQNK